MDELIRRVRDGECYSTSRYGDGEWEAVLSLRRPWQANCDRHRYFPRMCQELRQALINRPGYMLGLQNFGMRLYGNRINRFLRRHDLTDLVWYDGDELAMHRLSQRLAMDRWFKVLQSANVLMVGPGYLQRLKPRINWRGFVRVPPVNAFTAMRRIQDQVLDAYSKLSKPLVISISMGMPAGILVDRLFPKIGHDSFLLDMGSVYDFYAANSKRNYQRKLARRYSAKKRRERRANDAGGKRTAVAAGSGKSS